MIESHDYRVQLTGTRVKTGILESTGDGLPALGVASPPEFGGPAGIWSPEHLFVAAISACLMTTFRALAERSGMEVVDYSDDATGHLSRDKRGLYRMERVTLRPRVVTGDEAAVAKVHRLLRKAEQVCLIGNSVSSQIALEPSVLVVHHVGT